MSRKNFTDFFGPKEIGMFVLMYPSYNTVALSILNHKDGISNREMTARKVKDFLTADGTCYEIAYKGEVRIGVIFKKPLFMSHKRLEQRLKMIT